MVLGAHLFCFPLCAYLGDEVLGQQQARCAAPADAAEPFSTTGEFALPGAAAHILAGV